MTDSLLHAYLPLFAWTGLGVVLFRFLPDTFPRWLGRALYWVGVPLEILALTRRTQFSLQASIVPVMTITLLTSGLLVASFSLRAIRWWIGRSVADLDASKPPLLLNSTAALATSTLPHISDIELEPATLTWNDRSRQGAFLLSSMLGNTGFVGLAIVPVFISTPYLGWVVLYGITHNLFGTYGYGVLVSSYFSRQTSLSQWWMTLRDVLTVPSLWAFALGMLTHAWAVPSAVETGLQATVWIVIPAALVLMGMRISQLQGWKSLRLALIPTLIKVLVLPGLAGLLLTLMGMTNDGRLTLVLMAGMPTAFAGLILAEEYNLDRELISSSIVMTTLLLCLTIPLWLLLFGA